MKTHLATCRCPWAGVSRSDDQHRVIPFHQDLAPPRRASKFRKKLVALLPQRPRLAEVFCQRRCHPCLQYLRPAGPVRHGRDWRWHAGGGGRGRSILGGRPRCNRTIPTNPVTAQKSGRAWASSLVKLFLPPASKPGVRGWEQVGPGSSFREGLFIPGQHSCSPHPCSLLLRQKCVLTRAHG